MARRRLGLTASTVVELLLAAPASAQTEMQWARRDGEGRILLAYEVPETSDQSVVLVCDTRSRRFTVSYIDGRDRTRDGTRAKVVFASEGGKLALPMRAQKQELDDTIILKAEPALSPEWVRILSGQTLRITLSDDTESIPLAGARKGVAALAAGCSREGAAAE